LEAIDQSSCARSAIARILAERGVEKIGAIVVHALFGPDTPERLQEAGIARLVSSDSVTHPSNQIGLSATLADEIERRWSLREVN
jgi:ribose-phosphate pyrophosphokinase